MGQFDYCENIEKSFLKRGQFDNRENTEKCFEKGVSLIFYLFIYFNRC